MADELAPEFGRLAARAVEILVTHNEPVGMDDLACALGVSEDRVRSIAAKLGSLGYATVDDATEMITATPTAASPADQKQQDAELAALTGD